MRIEIYIDLPVLRFVRHLLRRLGLKPLIRVWRKRESRHWAFYHAARKHTPPFFVINIPPRWWYKLLAFLSVQWELLVGRDDSETPELKPEPEVIDWVLKWEESEDQ